MTQLGRDVWTSQLAPLLDALDVCVLARANRAMRVVAELLWPVLLMRDYGLREGGRALYRELRLTGVWRNPEWEPQQATGIRTIQNLFLGVTGSGRTCLLTRIIHNVFPTEFVPPVLDPFVFDMEVGELMAKMSLLDTVALPDFPYPRWRQLQELKTNVAAVCFNICHPSTREDAVRFLFPPSPTSVDMSDLHHDDVLVKAWVRELRHHRPDARVVVVGCQSDYRTSMQPPRPLRPFKWGIQVAREVNAYAYIEVSALTGQNVKELLSLLVMAETAVKASAVEASATVQHVKKCTTM